MRHRISHIGFTLIELLVVISIIALLIAILLPVLGSARATARTVLCSSNMKSVVLATHNYLTDNKHFYPRPAMGSTGSLTPTQRGSALWFNAIDYYLEQTIKNYTSSGPSAATERNYVQYKQDPVWKDEVIINSANGQSGNQTFKMNDALYDDAGGRYFTHESEIKRSQPLVLYVDGKAQDNSAIGAAQAQQFDASPGDVGLRHASNQRGAFSGGANVGFSDGAVRTITQKINYALVTPGWFTDSATNRANGNQVLAWILALP
ncbi:MAG: DUF1559 domain-containing protein [Phycisphaeraceae bacterium]|nr:DUF1559 domain-containing protein [Phycisphaeraceae bacterium]